MKTEAQGSSKGARLACVTLGVALLPWGAIANAQHPPGPSRVAQPSPPLIGDFDGDGRPDLATWNDADKKWSILFNCGNGFHQAVEWDGVSGTDGTAYVADLNGDGKADIIMWNNDVKQWSVNISTGSSFLPAQWDGLWGTDGAIHLADLNGDGKTDIIMWDNDVKQWSVNLSTGKGFKPERWDGLWGTDGLVHIADMNGDGKADVIMWYDAGKHYRHGNRHQHGKYDLAAHNHGYVDRSKRPQMSRTARMRFEMFSMSGVLMGMVAAAASAQTISSQIVDPEPTVSKSHPIALSVNYTTMIGNAPPGNCGCFLLNSGSSEELFYVWKNIAAVAQVTGSRAGSVPQSQQGLSLLTYMGRTIPYLRRTV